MAVILKILIGMSYLLNIKMLFTKRPIYCLTNNIVERLKVSLIKQSLDNRIYESNPQNDYFGGLPCDRDERLINRQ